MVFDIYARSIDRQHELVEGLHLNNLESLLSKCKINCWQSLLEFCVGEKLSEISSKKIITHEMLKKWIRISAFKSNEAGQEFRFIDNDNIATKEDLKKMILYLEICYQYDAILEVE
jgi:hypothetical protein